MVENYQPILTLLPWVQSAPVLPDKGRAGVFFIPVQDQELSHCPTVPLRKTPFWF